MAEVRFGEVVTRQDLATWIRHEGTLDFVLRKDSELTIPAEGPALATVFEQSPRIRSTQTTFEIRPDTRGRVDTKELGLLRSVVGISLVQATPSLRDSRGQEVRGQVLDSLWEDAQLQGGALWSGQHHTILFRDPECPIPKSLRPGSHNTFPFPEDFQSAMRVLAKRMGITRGFERSRTEEALSTFLYECVRNCHEHARRDAPSYRGVVFRKLIFTNEREVEARGALPAEVKVYIRSVWNRMRYHMLASFAIVDVGPGIHNTLQPKPDEMPWARLNRAFCPGESRKPQSGAIGRGEGLPRAIAAASRLGALLLVQSAELSGYRDFAVPGDSLNDDLLVPALSEVPNQTGTSITLLWPMTPDHPDQLMLFDR